MAKRRGKSKPSKPGRLRIVAGNWRSRLLEIADEPGLRPTAERLRETLFNWLAPTIEGAHGLDLFAGTGALGIEALSRGAASLTFVESSPGVAALLQRNLAKLDADNAEIVRGDALEYLADYRGRPFDIIFVDPPFADDMLADACAALHASEAIAAGTRVYLEDARSRALPSLPENWRIEKERTAGNVRYALLTITTA